MPLHLCLFRPITNFAGRCPWPETRGHATHVVIPAPRVPDKALASGAGMTHGASVCQHENRSAVQLRVKLGG